MYKWRLLLFASFAVFQPIASFTERNLVDGRQQCCDRLQYSLHQDIKFPIYGTYRANKFAPENRRLNTRRDISQNRRDDIKDLDSVFTRFTERQVSQQRGHNRIYQGPQARIANIERRRIGTFNIRDTRERTSLDDRDYLVSLYRFSEDETSPRHGNERRSRVSTESDRRFVHMRDSTQIFRKEIREAQNLLQGTRNDVVRREVTNSREGRRIAREADLDRRSYLNRAATRREINRSNRNIINQHVGKVDGSRLSSPSKYNTVETRKINDVSENRGLASRVQRNDERRLITSIFLTRPQFGEMERRTLDRNINQASRNTRSELRENIENGHVVNQDNRRFARNTNNINRYQIDDERKVMDKRNRDFSIRRVNQNRDSNNALRNIDRHERRSLSLTERRSERNVMSVDQRVPSRSLDRRVPSRSLDQRVPSRSLDRQDSFIVRSRRDTSVYRTREESRNNARDETPIDLRSMRDTIKQLDGKRQSMSQRIPIVNNISERQSLKRLATRSNENRRSTNAEELRDNINTKRNININDRLGTRKRTDLRRVPIFPSLSNSRETRHAEQRFKRRTDSRFLDSPVVIDQVRRVREDTISNLYNELREERRNSRRIVIDNRPLEKEDLRRNTKVSRHSVSVSSHDTRIDQRTQRSTNNFRLVEVRERLEIDANARNHRVRNSNDRRGTPLMESRMPRERDLAHDRVSRLNQRGHYQTFHSKKMNEAVPYRSKQEEDRTMIESYERFSFSESTRTRNTFVATNEKVPSFTPFVLDWQCVFYTLQSIYIFGILVQMLNDNGSTNGKTKSFRWWSAATRNAIKID